MLDGGKARHRLRCGGTFLRAPLTGFMVGHLADEGGRK